MKSSPKGFSLIELLIVVAIILIIAAIAIPNLLRSRIAANQASAVGSCRTINTAQINYSLTYNSGYSSSLVQLGPGEGAIPTASAADLIDSVLSTGMKSGYKLTYTPGSAVEGKINTYTITAEPHAPGTTGTNFYFTDESGVIRQNSGSPADEKSVPVGG